MGSIHATKLRSPMCCRSAGSAADHNASMRAHPSCDPLAFPTRSSTQPLSTPGDNSLTRRYHTSSPHHPHHHAQLHRAPPPFPPRKEGDARVRKHHPETKKKGFEKEEAHCLFPTAIAVKKFSLR